MPGMELRQIKRVLVATGLTPESIGGVVLGKEIAKTLGADLHAIHVVEPVSSIAEEAIPGMAEAHMAQAREELDAFAQRHGLADASTKLHVERGDAEVEIIRKIKETEADLLVLGRYGKGGLKRGRLGSIADRLVRKSPVSVVLAQPEFRGTISSIGIATTFDQECEVLIERACEMADVLGLREITIVHAYHLPVGYHRVMSYEEASTRFRDVAMKRTQKIQEQVASKRDIKLTLLADEGDTRDVVPRLVNGADIKLLIVAAHDRSRSAAFMLPRHTESIINNCNCSIWAIKRPEWYQGFLKALEELLGV